MKSRAIDGALATIAVILLAWMMAVQSSSTDTPTATALDVRQLELQPRLWDAQQALPDDIRGTIGLTDSDSSVDDPNNVLGSATEVVRGVYEQVDLHYAWSFEMQTVGIAIALALGETESVQRRISGLGPPSELDGSERDVVFELAALARREAPQSFVVVDNHLKGLGASTWLRSKLKAKVLAVEGKSVEAADLQEEAEDANGSYVQKMTALVLLTMVFFVLGLLLLLSAPWLSRALVRRGHSGLSITSSPFEGKHTMRVVAAWFLFYACSHVVISLAMMLLGPFVSQGPLSIATVSLLHGGASIVLIQTFGRLEGDNRSLGECLRFRVADASGGWGSFILWVLGGFALTVAIAVVAVFVNEAIRGDALDQQSSIQLFAQAQGGADLILLLTAVCLFAPVFEEILFRGFLYRNLRDRFGPWLGLSLSSFIFAVAHLDMSNMIPLFAIGFAFGLSYERSGSLWVPVIIHALWNSSTVVRILSLLG